MQKWWQQPFPLPTDRKHGLRMSFIAGTCVFCVLYFLQPFGISELSASKAAVLGVQFAIVTIVASLLYTNTVPIIFPKFFKEVRWTVLHEIVFLLLLILVVAFGNILFITFQFNTRLTGRLIFKMSEYTLAIGVLPVVISVVIKQHQLLIKYTRGAAEMETIITHRVAATEQDLFVKQQPIGEIASEKQLSTDLPPTTVLQITGANQQEKLAVAESDFLFAEASDNYSTIHYTVNGLSQKVLYRVSIKYLEAQTNGAEAIFRCHKSYLVNLKQVTQISGNAQGYKLHLLQNKFEIPVSRSLNARIKQEFDILNKLK